MMVIKHRRCRRERSAADFEIKEKPKQQNQMKNNKASEFKKMVKSD